MTETGGTSAQAVEQASRRFDATRSTDTSPAGRRRRVEARVALFEALLADGWEPDDVCLRQVELDRLALARSRPTAAEGALVG